MRLHRPKPPRLLIPRRRLLVSAASAAAMLSIPDEAFAATTTWNPSDKSSNITLSNSNLTASCTTAAEGGVRSTLGCSSGKVYFEITLGTMNTSTNYAIGIANASFTLTDPSDLGGSGNNSVGFFPTSSQQIWINNTVPSTSNNPDAAGDIIGIAVDFGAQLFWLTSPIMVANGQPWNNSSTANPGTGTGGISFSTLTGGSTYYVAFCDNTVNSACTANFGATAFNKTVPSGFVSWNAQVSGATASRARPRIRIVAAMGPQSIAAQGLQGSQPESAEGTKITTPGATQIWDASGNAYTLIASNGGQVAKNGNADSTTSNVTEIYYHNHAPYYLNSSGIWFYKPTPTSAWTQTSSPLTGYSGSITPLFWDDFSEGTIDWVNKWNGTPTGYGGTSTTNVGGRGGGNSYAPDQSVVQADCVSTKIIQYTDGNYYLLNTAFVAPSDRPSVMQPYTYATAEITTKFQHTYGYAIGRCKMPNGNGVMGAFWMYHTQDHHVQEGFQYDFEEIDMSENPCPANNTRPLSMTVHTNDSGYANGNNVYYDYWQPAQDCTHWHTYAVEWDAPSGNITFYLDGNQVWQKYTPPADLIYNQNIWVSMYTGTGNACVTGNGTWFGGVDNTTVFPQRSVYDWIGWFNNKGEADTFFSQNPQFSLATGGTDGPSLTGNP